MNPNLHENPFKRMIAKGLQPVIRRINSRAYVSLQYHYITGHKLNWHHLDRYTAKLQYLRLYAYKKMPNVIQATDRIEARKYVREIGLENILIPDLGTYRRFRDIPWDDMPHAFVIKCSHASGYNEIIINKKQANYADLTQKFEKLLRTNYGKKTVEPHYAKISPRLLVETYIGGNELPIEYKIHVFNGHARYLYIVTGRGRDIRYNNYYIDRTPFPEAQFNGWKSRPEEAIIWPENYEQMVAIAELLAKPFPFCRVDLYNVGGKIYFGEMTFTPAKGTLIFDNDDADFIIGKWLDITNL